MMVVGTTSWRGLPPLDLHGCTRLPRGDVPGLGAGGKALIVDVWTAWRTRTLIYAACLFFFSVGAAMAASWRFRRVWCAHRMMRRATDKQARLCPTRSLA